MRMFEKLHVGTMSSGYVTRDELDHAKVIYDRYVGFMKEHYGSLYGSGPDTTAVSLAEFLLQDEDFVHIDSFMMDKDVLVKTDTGKIGVTVGWKVGTGGFSVLVKTASGVAPYHYESLEIAEIPPEVLEYVKSTLQGRVHGKVDEAFDEC